MSSLIRIHDLAAYATAIAILVSLGASPLAMRIRALLARTTKRDVAFLPVYAVVLASAAALGAFVFGLPLLSATWTRGLAAIASGAAGGAIAARADVGITRVVFRRRVRRPSAMRITRGVQETAAVPVPGFAGFRTTSFAWVVGVGMLEETTFRGVLWQASLRLTSPIAIALALVAITFAFALAHLQFGWTQVFAKLPLSILAGAITLATGAVLGAAVLHGVFNAWIWREMREIGTRAPLLRTTMRGGA